MQQENDAVIFFYGTFMNAKVLEAFGMRVKSVTPAKLLDYELTIRPRVNIQRRDHKVVYGATTTLAHDDISTLYENLYKDFGVLYRPYAVIAHHTRHTFAPALCYISDAMEDADPDPDYIVQMTASAAQAGAPDGYLDHIRSFLNPERN